MARKMRFEYPGACHHVINYGNKGRDIFEKKGAAESFEEVLFEASDRFKWKLHAFVVMKDHFHLLVQTPEPNLSLGMKWLQGTWAARFNRDNGKKGRPFRGRYRSLLVEPGNAMARVSHYIHLNPVTEKVVTPARLLQYRRSSLYQYQLGKGRNPSLVATTFLQDAGGLKDNAQGHRKYVEFLQASVQDKAWKDKAGFAKMEKGWCMGSVEFKKNAKAYPKMSQRQLRNAGLIGHGQAAFDEVQLAGWEKSLRRAAKAAGIKLNRLPSAKSAYEKVLLAALLKAKTSVSNPWLAQRLSMGEPASASQFIRRFALSPESQSPRFKALLLKAGL